MTYPALTPFPSPSTMRPIIRNLDPTLINQIAAGEVIERPAAALKELIENAIDAQATHVDVVLRDGGKSLIQVTDNGLGMTGEDLLISIQRHATSKLPFDDLFNIQTFGFRGEALPSIGSVSRMTITSLPQFSDQTIAQELFVEGGVISPLRPAAYPKPGTRIIIKDLFYATPARLKFLKSDHNETTACLDVIKRLAIAHPNISFSCRVDDRSVLHYEAASSLSNRCVSVLGAKTIENLKFFEHERDGIRIFGMLSLPTFHKSQASDQYFFVNNRPVRDKLFLGTLKAGYQDHIEKGRHPVVAIFVTIDPKEVDVNVHPTKAEVRFRPEQTLRSLLIGFIRSTLTTYGQEAARALTHHMTTHTQPNSATLLNYAVRTSSEQSSFAKPSSSRISTHPLSFRTSPSSYQPTLPLNTRAYDPVEKNTIKDPDPIDAPVGFLGRAKGQIHKTYIIAETHNGMVIVDQHAAHERVHYEKLKEQYAHHTISKQFLMVPYMMTLSNQDACHLKDHDSLLKQLGFIIDIFDDSIVCRAIPSLLSDDHVETLVHDLIDDLKSESTTFTVLEKLLHRLSTHACHKSIRAGDVLSETEMNGVLRQIEKTQNSATCNHGRPTYVILLKTDIEKLFGRR